MTLSVCAPLVLRDLYTDHCTVPSSSPITPKRTGTLSRYTLSPAVPLPDPPSKVRQPTNLPTPSRTPDPDSPGTAPARYEYEWYHGLHRQRAAPEPQQEESDEEPYLIYKLRDEPDTLVRGRIGTECAADTLIVKWASDIQTVLPPAPQASVSVLVPSASLTCLFRIESPCSTSP